MKNHNDPHQSGGSDKTPIFLHPVKRKELLSSFQQLFNDERFDEAGERLKQLQFLEQDSLKPWVEFLLAVTEHLHCWAWQEKRDIVLARKHASRALSNYQLLRSSPYYESLDIGPLVSALQYNLQHMAGPGFDTLESSALLPKLFSK